MVDITKLKQQALDYHAFPTPGKIGIAVTKPAATQKDLALAYTPGVAEPVRAIHQDPSAAYRYTNKGNLVAVITDGTAVLGLGNVGPLAGKPVMEGKALLFKKFADIDVYDLEVKADNSDDFIETVTRIASGFGGINLEDIAAPACFEIEKALRERLDIPVFHDDQHGTAMIIAAGLLNALKLSGKKIADVRIVCLGAGAAGIASMRLLNSMGARKDNMLLVDRQGVVHTQRSDLNIYKKEFAIATQARTLGEALKNADVFIGVSGPDLLTPDMLLSMAKNPIVFALANPDPEILPEIAHETRSDVIMATGRSDYPNQINNVLGFPFIFRGALDAHAQTINESMLIAAANALAQLTHEPVPSSVLEAYQLESLQFGKDYLIPKPLDPRLIDIIPKAVIKAAYDTHAATR